MASLALARYIVPHSLDGLVQLALIDRVLKSQGMYRAGPFIILVRVAAVADFRRSKLGIRLVPFDQRRIIRIKLVVYIKDIGPGKGGKRKRPEHKNRNNKQ